MRIGLVVPRFHVDLLGGAELHARWLAEHLAAAGHEVTVLTTCALDATTWRNELPPGQETTDAGYAVHRFPADRRDHHEWTELDMAIRAGRELSLEDEERWLRSGGASSAMERDLETGGDRFDVVLGIPYMAATTYFAAQACPERFCVIPCLHDEPFARLGYVGRLLTRSVGALFNCWPERDLARRLHPRLGPSAMVGLGFEPPQAAEPDAVREKYGIQGPFVLFIGRLELDKNVPQLLEYFVRYKERNPGPVQLVLVGQGDVTPPTRDDVHQITIDWRDRDSLLAAATLLIQPSRKESLSIVTMQAWLSGLPVLAHAGSDVVRDHCLRSAGGLWFENYVEFEEMLRRLLEDGALAGALGRGGRAYVAREYSWPTVLDRFHDALQSWGLPAGTHAAQPGGAQG